jgi:serine/threonine protein kinase
MIAHRYQPLEAAPPGGAVKARDLQTAQTVMLRPIDHADDRLRGIFHPALLAIFDVFSEAAGTFAACEYVAGRSLRLIMGGQPFHARRASEIVAEVADGVAELHARGIYHGAISIDTVLLTPKGKAKLDLVHAVPSSEAEDLDQLRRFLHDLTGYAHPELATVESAAVLAARLRA